MHPSQTVVVRLVGPQYVRIGCYSRQSAGEPASRRQHAIACKTGGQSARPNLKVLHINHVKRAEQQVCQCIQPGPRRSAACEAMLRPTFQPLDRSVGVDCPQPGSVVPLVRHRKESTAALRPCQSMGTWDMQAPSRTPPSPLATRRQYNAKATPPCYYSTSSGASKRFRSNVKVWLHWLSWSLHTPTSASAFS